MDGMDESRPLILVRLRGQRQTGHTHASEGERREEGALLAFITSAEAVTGKKKSMTYGCSPTSDMGGHLDMQQAVD